MTPESAQLVAKEKEAKQRFDRALAAMRSQSGGDAASAVQAEVDEAKRIWEAAQKRLELFQAERARD